MPLAVGPPLHKHHFRGNVHVIDGRLKLHLGGMLVTLEREERE
jgi:hypothetical protein